MNWTWYLFSFKGRIDRGGPGGGGVRNAAYFELNAKITQCRRRGQKPTSGRGRHTAAQPDGQRDQQQGAPGPRGFAKPDGPLVFVK